MFPFPPSLWGVFSIKFPVRFLAYPILSPHRSFREHLEAGEEWQGLVGGFSASFKSDVNQLVAIWKDPPFLMGKSIFNLILTLW
jgi:hypothetical protein